MQSVNVIAAQDVSYDITYIPAVFIVCRIKYILSVIFKYHVGPLACYMVGGKGIGVFRLRTVRVYPGMKFHASLMALVNHPLQRVPIRRRGLALLSGQESAPRLYIALI